MSIWSPRLSARCVTKVHSHLRLPVDKSFYSRKSHVYIITRRTNQLYCMNGAETVNPVPGLTWACHTAERSRPEKKKLRRLFKKAAEAMIGGPS